MKYIFLTLNLLLVSCADNNKTSDVKTVNLGNFSFMVPINSKIETLKSIDTQAGKITFDSTVVYFDYGYSAISPNAVKTELEFIQKGRWLPDAVVQIMPKNHTYSSDTIREKVKIINIDYKNYTAILSYNSYNFFYKIQIPDYLKGVIERKDTIRDIIQRLIYNKKPYNGKYSYEFQNIKYPIDEYLNNNILVFKTTINSISDTTKIFTIFSSTKFK